MDGKKFRQSYHRAVRQHWFRSAVSVISLKAEKFVLEV